MWLVHKFKIKLFWDVTNKDNYIYMSWNIKGTDVEFEWFMSNYSVRRVKNPRISIFLLHWTFMRLICENKWNEYLQRFSEKVNLPFLVFFVLYTLSLILDKLSLCNSFSSQENNHLSPCLCKWASLKQITSSIRYI